MARPSLTTLRPRRPSSRPAKRKGVPLSPLAKPMRHYGFAHSRSKIDPEWLKMLVTTSLSMIYTLIVSSKPPRAPYRLTCPDCGGRLICTGIVLADDGIARDQGAVHAKRVKLYEDHQ